MTKQEVNAENAETKTGATAVIEQAVPNNQSTNTGQVSNEDQSTNTEKTTSAPKNTSKHTHTTTQKAASAKNNKPISKGKGTSESPKETSTVTDELTAVLEEIVEEPVKEKKKGEIVTLIDETNILVGERQYHIVHNHREGFDADKLGERYSEVLSRYDYIVGDWGYEQLRLKGFFKEDNRKAYPDQRIDTLEDYLYEYCNFGCAYFVIERVGGKREKPQNRRRRKKSTTQNQAHIEEKKVPVSSKKKPKPIIKKREDDKGNSAKKEAKKTDEHKKPEGKKAGFTIRQREK